VEDRQKREGGKDGNNRDTKEKKKDTKKEHYIF